MIDAPDHEGGPHRQQNLYLTEVFQLIVARDYIRLYRNILERQMSWFNALRAIASSGAIAAWAVWRAHPLIWAAIIAASQVADALKDVFPFTARHKAANDLLASLEALPIEALYEAERVYAGEFTDSEINDRRRKLMRLSHQARQKHFPAGDLPERKTLLALADRSAAAYFDFMFGPRIRYDQDQ